MSANISGTDEDNDII